MAAQDAQFMGLPAWETSGHVLSGPTAVGDDPLSGSFGILSAGEYGFLITGVGYGNGKNKVGHYKLETSALAAPVPEASTWAMMAAGLGVLALVTRRRRPQA